MFKSLAALTAAAVTTAPAHALTNLSPAMKEWVTTHPVLVAVEQYKTDVVIDHKKLCEDKQGLGAYYPNVPYKGKVYSILSICVSNHKGDVKELEDTIIHETIHVIQECRARMQSIAKGRMSSIRFDGTVNSYYHYQQSLSSYDQRMIVKYYPFEQRAKEAEARVMAKLMSRTDIAETLEQSCGTLLRHGYTITK